MGGRVGEPTDGHDDHDAGAANDSVDPYRASLQKMSDDSGDDYGKAILSLSGGALGISFAFAKDFAGSGSTHTRALVIAWCCWATSLACVLVSYYTARLAAEGAIGKWDKGERDFKKLSGRFNRMTKALNVAAGGGFILGVIAMAIFASVSLGGKVNDSQGQTVHEETISIQTLQEGQPVDKKGRKALTKAPCHR